MDIDITVNGMLRRAHDVRADATLLEVLREHLELPGTKNACEQGECGSCSVILDGELVNSCLVLAAQATGSTVRTIEGFSNGQIHPLQAAFAEAGAVQCGFCIPGMIVAAETLLATNATPTEDEIREALEGNLCRCTGYQKIIEAVKLAADRMARS